jgi:putative redox protein
MTIRLFADRKKWPLRRVTVTVKEMGKDLHGTLPDGLQLIVSLEGELTTAQKERLIEVSANCPVKKMMLGKMRDGISVHLSS